MSEIMKEVEDVMSGVMGDIKTLAKQYGGYIIIGLVCVYVWRLVNKKN